MKVAILFLACLASLTAGQSIIFNNGANAACSSSGGCSLNSILDASVIAQIVGTLTGQTSLVLDFSTLSSGATVNIDASGGFALLSSLTVAALNTGSATVNIAAGFTVNTYNFAVQAGSTAVVNGVVAIQNSAATATNVTVAAGATLYVAASGAVQAGASAISASGNANVAGSITTTGPYTQQSGYLTLNSTTTASTAAVVSSAVTIATNAILTGNGAIGATSAAASAGVTISVSGTIAVGNSPGTITMNGDWRPSGTAVYNFEAASASSYDQLIVNGKAYVNGFCKCTLLNNYGPADNTRFPSITATGGTAGSFSSTIGTQSNTLTKWSSSVTSNQVIMNYNSAVSVAISGLVLVACVLASLL